MQMSESQTSQLSVTQNQQQNENFLGQKRQRSGSESATLPGRNLTMNVSSVSSIGIENLLQQQRNCLDENVNFSMQQINSDVQSNNNNNNDERYQQQSLILGFVYCL